MKQPITAANLPAQKAYTYVEGGHEMIYMTGNYRFYVKRDLGAPVSPLYAAVGTASSALLRTSDASPLAGLRAGTYDVVVQDDTARDGLGLIGPGVRESSTAAYDSLVYLATGDRSRLARQGGLIAIPPPP